MEKCSHVTFDGYNIDTNKLDNTNEIKNFLENINIKLFNGKCKLYLIPYFNGKVKVMGGISAILFGDNIHLTCHTFSFLNCVFIDYYGSNENKVQIKREIEKYFNTNNYDYCENNNDKKGNFGKHIILETQKEKPFEECKELIKKIVVEIEMTPIYELITNYKDEYNFDIIQLIAESHIAIHVINKKISLDVFSCKDFDENKIIRAFEKIENLLIVNRGIYFLTNDIIKEKEKIYRQEKN